MKKYIPAADLIRTIAILGAVSIHIVQPVYSRFDFMGGFTWWICNLWNAASRTSIPLFIMLSGLLLLNKTETTKARFNRIVTRIIIPLLFWFGFYVIWNGGYPDFKRFDLLIMVNSLLTSSVFHLYFLIILIGLYIFIPWIQKSLLGKRLWILFIVLGIFLTIAQYQTHNPIFTSAFTFWIPYLGYFIAGQRLGKFQPTKLQINSLRAILVFSFFTTAFLSYKSLFWLHQGNTFLYPSGVLSPYFDHYLSPNVVILSICAFILLLQFKIQNSKLQSMLKFIAKNSFGIFLIHSIIIDFIDKPLHLSNDFVHFPLLPYLILKYLLVFSVSLVLVNIGRNIPILRRAFGEKA